MIPKDEMPMEQQAVQIPYFVHESEMYRMERLNKRWFIAFLVALAMLFVTNGAWIAYELQYETYALTQEVDTRDGTAVVTGIGDAVYGED